LSDGRTPCTLAHVINCRGTALAKKAGKKATATASDEIRTLQGTAFREHSALLYSMHELSRLISTMFDKAMSEHRLTHAQWWALMHIFEHEGATQTELAEILQMGRASTGKLLERLEAKHWIERRQDAEDSRARRVFLRHEVVPVFQVMTAEGRRLFEVYLKGISAAEEVRLIAGLRKIKANAERG
jgi:MarR family transcriptional regulator, transcriptional regulator for hemolysin